VFGLAFEFGFCSLKAKRQTKWLDPKNSFFSKSRLSQCAKLNVSLDLLLAAFVWNCENIYGRIFSGFYFSCPK
jgi:hypothetical protein